MSEDRFQCKKLKKYSDERGDLFEMIRFIDDKIPYGGQIYCYTVNQGFRRGDHYHKLKQEWVTCVSGEVEILLENADGNTKKIKLSSEDPAIVYFEPMTSHAVFNPNTIPAVIVSYSSTQHNEEDEDTFLKTVSL